MLNHDLASTSREVLPGSGAHLVQFYDREDYLYEVVATFIGQALPVDEPVVVIATPEHRRGFTDALVTRGFDPARVLFSDARETMAQFMSGGMPDAQRFMSTLGGVLEQMIGGHARIRAYGEMVDLLWRDGNPEAAVRLEELWNDLSTLYPFTLLCAYPMGNFYKESDARLFDHVCATHGHVFPAESFNRGGDDDARMREIAALQQRAATLEAEINHRRELELALREALAARRSAEDEPPAQLEENSSLYALAQDNIRTKDENRAPRT